MDTTGFLSSMDDTAVTRPEGAREKKSSLARDVEVIHRYNAMEVRNATAQRLAGHLGIGTNVNGNVNVNVNVNGNVITNGRRAVIRLRDHSVEKFQRQSGTPSRTPSSDRVQGKETANENEIENNGTPVLSLDDTSTPKRHMNANANANANNYSAENSNIETNEYLRKVMAKRKLNEQRMHDLGLVDFGQQRKKRKRQQWKKRQVVPPVSNIHTRSTHSNAQQRRSARKANKPALYSGEEIDSIRQALPSKHGGTTRSTTRSTTKKSHKIDITNKITPTQRHTFKNTHHNKWLQDMEQYFLKEVGNSSTNVQRVIGTVKKLVNGEGIQHPTTRAYFKRNVHVQLHDDFYALLDEASEWVCQNGGDRGHGWLVEHPVKKCLIYQHARFHHGKSLNKKYRS